MKRRAILFGLFILAALGAPPERAAAVAYFPLVHREPGDESLARPGATVYLFHSGTEDSRRALRVGETLTVVRVLRTCEPVTVGTVRLISAVGDTYLKAEVVSGAVKPNDIAAGLGVSCLVLAAEPCGRR